MLEKITTSAPFCCTLSTSDTYRFLVFGSLALQKLLYLDYFGRKYGLIPEKSIRNQERTDRPSICS